MIFLFQKFNTQCLLNYVPTILLAVKIFLTLIDISDETLNLKTHLTVAMLFKIFGITLLYCSQLLQCKNQL